jgi:hypothetical protein
MSSASVKGVPGIRIVLESIPGHTTVMEYVEAGVSAVMDDIVAALTRPLTPEEKSPKPKVEKSSRIVFKGNLEEVNQFFYKRGWTDGLPIIPPTEEAVAEMLTGTDLPPDHLVRTMIPRLGKATVEKIAINAVMAGALPTYMPVLIAAIKTYHDTYNWVHTSAASPGPLWIINGPIRTDINVNCGRGVFSPGNIANAAIGRTMGFIDKNICGIRKGVEEMGGMGNPGKYTMVIGENEEESPWEPFHVERSFNKEDSTITFFVNGNNFNQTGAGAGDIKGILNGMINTGRRGMGGVCFMISPPRAEVLSEAGWGKKDVKTFISENATAPYSPEFERTGLAPQEGGPRRLPFNLGDPVRLMPDLNNIMIVVAGGAWPGNGAVVTGGLGGVVTKKIELPANWGKLVEKYKNVIPTYALY